MQPAEHPQTQSVVTRPGADSCAMSGERHHFKELGAEGP